MSGRMVGRVVEVFPETTKKYTLMLSLANRAGDDGAGVRFDLERIAREARMSERHAERFLKELVQDGWVQYHEDSNTLSLHFPVERKVTKERWQSTRRSRPRKQVRLAPRGMRTAAKGAHPGLKNYDQILPLFFKMAVPKMQLMGDNLQNYGEDSAKTFQKNPLNSCAGRPFHVPYVLIRPLKDVVIPTVIDCARTRDADNNQASPENEEIKKPAWWDEAGAASLDAWAGSPEDSEADLASSPALQPDGCAPDGAASDFDLAGLDDLLDGAFDAQPTSLEEVPGAAAAAEVTVVTGVPLSQRPAFGADSPERKQLAALCGGPANAPFLNGLLGERTRGGQDDRSLWLRLNLDELQQARKTAQTRLSAGEAHNFNSAIIEALDELVDGYRAGTAAPERAASLRVSAAQPVSFESGERVMRAGQLGVVVSVCSDERQAVVTVDLDSGERIVLTGPQADRELHRAPTAPPPPARDAHSPYPVNSTWRLPSGQVVTVTSYALGRPTTDDGTVWPAFGAGALAKVAERVGSSVEAAS